MLCTITQRHGQGIRIVLINSRSKSEVRKRVRTGRYRKDQLRDEADWDRPCVRSDLQTSLLKLRVIPEKSLCPCGAAADMICSTCNSTSYRCSDCLLSSHSNKAGHRLWKTGQGGIGLVIYKPLALPNLYPEHLADCHAESSESLTSNQILMVGMSECQKYVVHSCSCSTLAEQVVSLGYWGNRPTKPTIAFSVECLNLYRSLNRFCKVSGRGFCQSLCDEGTFVC